MAAIDPERRRILALRSTRFRPWACALLLTLAGPLAAQQEATRPPRANWEAGWHVVRPGDTLEGLARRFLGSHTFWRELHRLNPSIADPDVLSPGQRVRIWIARPSSQPNAQVEQVAGRVEERPSPVPWRPAEEGDLLLERDGLRTFEAGSTRLRFEDESSVTLTENSLVFLRRQTPVTAPVPSREIEVRLGRADVEAPAASGERPAPDIDIVLGPARARAMPAPSGEIHARSSAEEQGTARLMIYRGSGELESAGQRVELAEGTGSSAAPAAAPTPPETLLPAPALVVPAAGAELGRDDPFLAWNDVEGAASYIVEVCSDAACGMLFERAAGLTGTRYRIGRTVGEPLHWRVTAVSATGLEGFPSAARSFRPVDSVAPPPPTVVLRGSDGRPVADGDCVAARPALEVDARDRYGRALGWELSVDDVEVPPESWTGLTASGPHRVVARAVDARGRTTAADPIGFVLDQVAPWADLPPRPDSPRASFWQSPRTSFDEVCALGLEVSVDDGPWLAVPCSADASGPPASFPVSGFESALELRARAGVRLGTERPLLPDERLRVRVGDIGCGLSEIRIRVTSERLDGGPPALEIVPRDRAGRESRNVWRAEAR